MAAKEEAVVGGGEVGGCGVEEEATTGSTTATPVSGSAPGSPKCKVKFLCSHGGKILPRPADGHLKYIGGQTRIVSVPRDNNFSDLMKKLASLSDGDTVLKYQLIPEDLDTLVSVKSDVDLRHMINEHDHYESAGTPMLRAFLFPANPIVVENQTSSVEPVALEQRYIDAVNGIIRATTAGTKLQPVITRNPSPSCLSPAGSSPMSPESSSTNFAGLEPPKGYQKSRILMHRVHSLPSISSIGNHNTTTTTHPVHHHNHQYHQNHQLLQQHGFLSPRAQEPERLVSVRSVGREDSWKYQAIPSRSSHYPMTTIARQNRGNGCYCSKCMHFDEYGAYANRKLDRGESIFRSPPLTSSPS